MIFLIFSAIFNQEYPIYFDYRYITVINMSYDIYYDYRYLNFRKKFAILISLKKPSKIYTKLNKIVVY